MGTPRGPAKTARDARWNCQPQPLDESQSDWYVDLQHRLGLRIGGANLLTDDFDPAKRPEGRWLHLALAGPRGSGKSTLVQQCFPKYRQLGLHPVHVDVLDALDPASISYSDLMLTLLVAIDDSLEKEAIQVDPNARADVLAWFAERVLTTEHLKELGIEVSATAEGGASVPFIGKLLARVTAAFKGGSRYREEIRQRIDARPNELVDKVNFYLDAATQALRKNLDRKEILVFFDNLEKVTNAPEQVDAALIQRCPLFQRLRCHAIFTLPFGLLCAPGQGGLPADAFDIRVVPMVALRSSRQPREHLDPDILREFRGIIEKRVDVATVFESNGSVDEIARASGGCPRDLLRIAEFACQYAGDGRVSAAHVTEAIRRAGQEHARTAIPGDWERLAAVHREKRIVNDPEHHRLIYHRLVLRYDDVEWDDVHPLVWHDDRFERAWAQASGLAAP